MKMPVVLVVCVLAAISVAIPVFAQPEPVVDSESVVDAAVAPVTEQTALDPGWGEMTPERRAQAIEYSDTRHLFYFITTFFTLAVLMLLMATGISGRLGAWAQRVGRKGLFVLAIYLFVVSLILMLLDLPFSYYLGYSLEHQYGLSNQTLGAWLGEMLKGQAVSYVVLLVIVWLVYLAIRNSPRRWWIWVGACTAPLVAFFIVVAPIVIAPMFNNFTPLSDSELKEKILSLAARAEIHGSDVFEVDASRQSSKYNAYVTGLFGSKRIVLYDTILKDMTDDEILFIMAHEMGHYTMHHIWYGVIGTTIFLFFAAFVTARFAPRLIERYQSRWKVGSLSEFGSLPLLLFFVMALGFLGQPIFNGVSRYFEHQSDAYGIRLAPDRRAAAAAFEKLAANNLSNPDPSAFIEFWLYTHPTIKDRVEFVLSSEGEG